MSPGDSAAGGLNEHELCESARNKKVKGKKGKGEKSKRMEGWEGKRVERRRTSC